MRNVPCMFMYIIIYIRFILELVARHIFCEGCLRLEFSAVLNSVHTQTRKLLILKMFILSSTRCLIVHTDVMVILSILYFDQSFLLTSFFPSNCLVFFTRELQILECCTCIYFFCYSYLDINK